MPRAKTNGLKKVGNVWHVCTSVRGYGMLRASTGRRNKQEAAVVRDRMVAEAKREVALRDDPYREAKRVSPIELAERYLDHLSSVKGRTAGHVACVRNYLTTLLGGIQRMESVTLARLEKAVADLPVAPYDREPRKGEITGQTANAYIKAARAFSTYLKKKDLWYVDFAAGLDLVPEHEKTHLRRAITWEELTHFLASVPDTALGQERRRLYTVAVWTGLRRSELRRLDWSDVQTDGDEPHLIVRGTKAKNRRGTVLPLVPSAADALREQRAYRPDAASVFGRSPRMDTYRADLARAGIPYTVEDEVGREYAFDFHALRGMCATALKQADIHPSEAQKIMRHSDIQLTYGLYAKTGSKDMREALEKAESASLQYQSERVDSPASPEPQNQACRSGGTGRRARFRNGEPTQETGISDDALQYPAEVMALLVRLTQEPALLAAVQAIAAAMPRST